MAFRHPEVEAVVPIVPGTTAFDESVFCGTSHIDTVGVLALILGIEIIVGVTVSEDDVVVTVVHDRPAVTVVNV
jgi:hypothetical protein